MPCRREIGPGTCRRQAAIPPRGAVRSAAWCLLLWLAGLAAAADPDWGREAVRQWDNVGGSWQWDGQVLRCQGHRGGWGDTLLVAPDRRTDLEITARLLAIAEDEAGFVLRYQGPREWIGVLLDDGGAVVYHRQPEGTRYLAKRRKDVYAEGRPLDVAVRVVGRTLVLHVDGMEKLRAELPPARSGRVGLFSCGRERGLAVSRFAVTSLDPPAAGPAAGR